MFNEIIMILASLVFVAVMGYLAYDSYKEFKEHDPK
jgi:hypothetical protein